MASEKLGQAIVNKKGGRDFLRVLTAFTALVLLPFLGVAISAFLIGEVSPYEQIIALQNDSAIPVVYYPELQRQDHIEYKLLSTIAANPDLLVIGSSRMLSFSAGFANLAPERFHNASLPTMGVGEEFGFLEALIAQGIIPEVLILGIDFPQFSQEGFYRESDLPVRTVTAADYFARFQQAYGLVLGEWVLGNMPRYLGQINTDSAIWLGLQANQFHSGYLPDGSLYFADTDPTRYAEKLETHRRNFANRVQMFVGGNNADTEVLAQLGALLALAQANGIEVMGILPPYHPSIYEPMIASGDFNYIGETRSAVTRLFADYDFTLFDYSEPSSYGGSSADLRDGWHTSEVGSLRMYLGLLQARPAILGPFSNAESLQADLENAPNNYQVYPLLPP